MMTVIKKLFANLVTIASRLVKRVRGLVAIEVVRFEIAKLQCQPGDAIVIKCDRMLNAHQVQQIRAMVEPVRPEGVTVLVLSGLSLDVLTQGPGGGSKV